MALTTKCCLYAWQRIDDFSIDNHLIVSPSSYKGRPIGEANIQEYVSDVTSKYLPTGHSPWQVHVLNGGQATRGSSSSFQQASSPPPQQQQQQQQQVCRFLVRVHHLLLRQEKLCLGDFLPLKPSQWPPATTTDDEDAGPSSSRLLMANQASVGGGGQQQRLMLKPPNALPSPFANLYSEPQALPRLHQKLTESFSNVWNEFLCNNDPTERPEILKKRIGVWQCSKIAVIVCFSTAKEIKRQYHRKEGPSVLASLWPAYKREARKRNFTLGLVLQAMLNLLNPAQSLRSGCAWLWYLLIVLSLKAPILLWRELRAASLLYDQQHYYPDSLVADLAVYLPLLFNAVVEVLSILGMILSAPFVVFEELLRSGRSSAQLRTASQTGRKVVAWSDEIELDLLERIAGVSGASDAEILLAGAVDSLKEYFKCSGQQIPDEILATAKFTSQRALYVSDREPKGLLCLALPTTTPNFEDDLVDILQAVQSEVAEARSRQRALYAITQAETASGVLTSCLPSIILKVVLNQLTRRYSISVTHVDGDLPVEGIQSAVFWKPPQGNLNLSMSLHRHGRGVRLGVMGDAMIGPQHAAITRAFPRSLKRLARTLGVEASARDRLRFQQQQQQQQPPSNPIS
ncbi:uncharacterized protein LOC106656201 isoform X2 [Trichogramma pretiosum]|nr:uncharacterized protein LOC106656201 isoform X2 [Trichogramma pretiosum]